MSDIEKARQRFHQAGLSIPAIPEPLAACLQEKGEWVYATRELEEWTYKTDSYIQEASDGSVQDYAILCHAGHGINSYFIQYYLVHRALRIFLSLSWGGAYTDNQACAAHIRTCFSLVDQIVEIEQSLQMKGGAVTIVCDKGSNYWLKPGVSPRKSRHSWDREATKGEIAILEEALHWLKNYQRKTSYFHRLWPLPCRDNK